MIGRSVKRSAVKKRDGTDKEGVCIQSPWLLKKPLSINKKRKLDGTHRGKARQRVESV